MSLAMFAAPFNDNIDNNNSDNNIMNNKRRLHSRTQKMYSKENFDTNKVNSILDKIHSNLDSDDEEKDNFNPPPKSESAGVQKTIPQDQKSQKEQMMNMTSNNDSTFRTIGKTPEPNYEDKTNLDLNDYKNYGDNKTNDEYYRRVIPGYNQGSANQVNNQVNNQASSHGNNMHNRPYYNTVNYAMPNVSTGGSQDVLLQKLNYMITLLEDQQDERTNNVTEEVVLYSFLGIFIIFIADSFVKAGKYVR